MITQAVREWIEMCPTCSYHNCSFFSCISTDWGDLESGFYAWVDVE